MSRKSAYRFACRNPGSSQSSTTTGRTATAQTVAVPGTPTGPGGSVTFFNLSPAYFGAAFVGNVYENQDILDTDHSGADFTLAKRFSGRWQMLAGLTLGSNRGGALTSGDLNDPNVSQNFAEGVVGPDSKHALRLSGSHRFPGDVNLAMTLVSNGGYPYQSTYNVIRTVFPSLTRASQTVRLSERGGERLPNVTLIDLRLSRAFSIGGGRSINPQLDLFNVTNASTFLTIKPAVGSVYRVPTEILALRILRLGLTMVFWSEPRHVRRGGRPPGGTKGRDAE